MFPKIVNIFLRKVNIFPSFEDPWIWAISGDLFMACLTLWNVGSTSHFFHITRRRKVPKKIRRRVWNISREVVRYWFLNLCAAFVSQGETMIIFAAKLGNDTCLRFLHVQSVHWNEYACIMAFRFGALRCLMFAHLHEAPCIARTCAVATLSDDGCLHYLHACGVHLDENTYSTTSISGSLTCRVGQFRIYNRAIAV